MNPSSFQARFYTASLLTFFPFRLCSSMHHSMPIVVHKLPWSFSEIFLFHPQYWFQVNCVCILPWAMSNLSFGKKKKRKSLKTKENLASDLSPFSIKPIFSFNIGVERVLVLHSVIFKHPTMKPCQYEFSKVLSPTCSCASLMQDKFVQAWLCLLNHACF